jgi:hypothetical protein
MLTAAWSSHHTVSTLQEIDYFRALKLVDSLNFQIKLSENEKDSPRKW